MATTKEHPSLDKKILIVGGGPSGAATAKALGDRGFSNVHLYEAYPHPKNLSKTSSKAYVIAINSRGQNGIRASTGIDLVQEASDPSNKTRGVVSHDMARHNTNKKNQTSARCRNHEGNPSLIIPRKALAERLLEAAEESGATIHYRHRLQDVDFDRKVATFADGGGTDVKVGYDLLLGADGSNSRVRGIMSDNQTSLKDFSVRTEEDSMEYQVAVLPRNPFEASHPNGTAHVWNNAELNAICLGFPLQPTEDNEHQSLLLAVVFPEGKLGSFSQTKDGYRPPLAKLLPDLFDENNDNDNNSDAEENFRIVEEQLRANQIANGGLCVWSSSLGQAVVDPKTRETTSGVILLGDAAHGMWPSLGQGANCALESVAVFAKCLDAVLSSAGGPNGEAATDRSWIASLVRAYNDARLEDARAAVDLTYGGIGARESRGRQNAPITFKLQVAGMMVLHKLTLGVVPMPALMQLLLGSKDVSYQKLKKFNFCYEKYICLGALAIATTLIVVWRNNVLPFPTARIAGADL